MTDFIAREFRERITGLSLHYPFLYALVVGLGARRTLEFGAGGSTRVILDAGSSEHVSVSTETKEQIAARGDIDPSCARWRHLQATLGDTGRKPLPDGPFDLVLHDGSHAADVVAADIAWAWPRLKRFGLLLVHDTLHSYCGAQVRAGLECGLGNARASRLTLPYGYGLTIVRREDGDVEVKPAKAKATSPHLTELLSW